MKNFCDYYKQTIVCSGRKKKKCGWTGPWQIFRYDGKQAMTYPDGMEIDESGYAPKSCPRCGSDFAGHLANVFSERENPYVLYIWDEQIL